MSMNRLMGLFLLGLAVAGCTATGRQTLFDRGQVVHPEALFDVASRSAVLRKIQGGKDIGVLGDKICLREQDVSDYGPLIGPSLGAIKGGRETNRAARDFARGLNRNAYYLLMSNDDAEARRGVAALRRHADAGAWLVSEPSKTDAGAVIDAMGAVLPAWHILRQTSAVAPVDQKAIQAWLVRLAQQADVHSGENSVSTARGANDMMLGLMVGDDARYRKGIASGFVPQLSAMRPDGSFPRETERGRAALQQQSRNIALLLYAAEIAASQGENLYGMRVNGKGVEDAIRFLLAAAEDNALVDVYAAANVNPGDAYPVFAPMSQADPLDTSVARAWAMLYTERFPGNELSTAIREKIAFGPRVYNDLAGGGVSCYATRI
jgi:poly(beta-D-mannuronate) lyase